jgi:adenosylcobinamide amidohydrolase
VIQITASSQIFHKVLLEFRPNTNHLPTGTKIADFNNEAHSEETGPRRQSMTINIFALTNAVLLAAGMVYLAAAF